MNEIISDAEYNPQPEFDAILTFLEVNSDADPSSLKRKGSNGELNDIKETVGRLGANIENINDEDLKSKAIDFIEKAKNILRRVNE